MFSLPAAASGRLSEAGLVLAVEGRSRASSVECGQVQSSVLALSGGGAKEPGLIVSLLSSPLSG